MECLCCKNEFSDELSECPVCGFKAICVVEGGAESISAIKKYAAEHREKKMKDVRLSVLTYSWKEEAGKLAQQDKKLEFVATGEQLLKRGEIWTNTTFARTISSSSVELRYQIRERGELHVAFVPTPEGVSFWRLGVRVLEDSLGFKFLLKSDMETKSSAILSLI